MFAELSWLLINNWLQICRRQEHTHFGSAHTDIPLPTPLFYPTRPTMSWLTNRDCSTCPKEFIPWAAGNGWSWFWGTDLQIFAQDYKNIPVGIKYICDVLGCFSKAASAAGFYRGSDGCSSSPVMQSTLCGQGVEPYQGMLCVPCSLIVLFSKHLWAKVTLYLAVNSQMCLKLDKSFYSVCFFLFYLRGGHQPILSLPFATALCELIQKSSGDLHLRNHSCPALLSLMWTASGFCLMRILWVSIKIFLNSCACGRTFLFFWFLKPETAKDTWNYASWGHIHLPMSCILADLVRWFSRGCLWQRVKRERVQRKGSGLPVGMCGSARVTARCCVWQPSQLPCTPEPVVLLLWQQAEEQVELGRDIAPRQGHSSVCPCCRHRIAHRDPNSLLVKEQSSVFLFFIFFWLSV